MRFYTWQKTGGIGRAEERAMQLIKAKNLEDVEVWVDETTDKYCDLEEEDDD